MGVRLWLGSEKAGLALSLGTQKCPRQAFCWSQEQPAGHRTWWVYEHAPPESSLWPLLSPWHSPCDAEERPWSGKGAYYSFHGRKAQWLTGQQKGDKWLGLSLDLSASPPTGHWAPWTIVYRMGTHTRTHMRTRTPPTHTHTYLGAESSGSESLLCV